MSERAWKLGKTPSYENLSMIIKNLPLHWMKAFSFWRWNPYNHSKAAADMCFPSAASNLERVACNRNTINPNDPLWFLDWILWNQSRIMNEIVLVEFDGGESRNNIFYSSLWIVMWTGLLWRIVSLCTQRAQKNFTHQKRNVTCYLSAVYYTELF